MPRIPDHRATPSNTRTTHTTASATTSTTTAATGSDDASTSTGVEVPTHTAADSRPEFRVSVRGVAGQATPKPALADDWRDASLSGEAKYLASVDVDKEVAKIVKQESSTLGRDLDDDEVDALADAANKKFFAPAYGKHYAAIMKSTSSQDAAIQQALQREGTRLAARGRDPFTPIALGDPAALAKEVVLFQDAKAMVVVDQFARGPKALVVPKKQAMFPGDVSKADLDHLAKLSQKVSDAFHKVAGSQPADIWLNPPQRVTLKQLHVHVQPHLPTWEKNRRPRGVPPPPDLVAEQARFYAAMIAELAGTTGG